MMPPMSLPLARAASRRIGQRSVLRPALLSALPWTLLGVMSCAPPVEPEAETNLPPVARATFPQRWLANRPAPVDARFSFDPEGALSRISVLFGNAVPEVAVPGGQAAYAFPHPGTFDVRVEVEDDVGQVARLIGTIVVVEELAAPACSCTSPCPEGAFCSPEGCFVFASSDLVDARDAGPPPDVTSWAGASGERLALPAIPCDAPDAAPTGGAGDAGAG